MKHCMFLLLVCTPLLGAALGSQVDLEHRVAQQADRIRSISGHSEEGFFELPGVSPRNDGSPIVELIRCGMAAIPYLVPYLSDTSPTQAYRTHGSGMKRRALVNEYVLFVINKIAEHNFYSPAGPDGTQDYGTLSPILPASITELELQILSWWQVNRMKPILERKLEDVNDPIHDNRFWAYEWLGRSKAKEGRQPLEKRIQVLLTGQVDSLKQDEMAACAESLAQIGVTNSAPAVRTVCDHLSYWMYMSYRPKDEGRSGTWSGQVATLFKAYKALATLGFKDEALSRLEELKSKYLTEMEASVQEEFLREFERARDW